MQRILASRRSFAGLTAWLIAALLLHVGFASAQAPAKEIRLTQSHIDSFVKLHAKKELGALLWEVLASGKADRAMLAKIDRAVQKQGLKSYTEYLDVQHSIGLVITRIDPQTRKLIDRGADGAAIREASNIDLVIKNYDKIVPVF
jgi:hypothetical protein